MTEIRRKIAQRIRSCRIAAGWTVDETVRRLSLISSESISPSRYGNWEQQVRTPKIEQLAELAALFKKSAAWLTGRIDHDGTTGEG
ncbi:helix-turn-helix domain-containing protein, partial [Pseudomonas sp. AL15]|nr:helix-turn-helix domain-containing protein [Pseudomonas sp. AL15]